MNKLKSRSDLKLFELEKEDNTTKDTLEKAVLSYADLSYADLSYASLRGPSRNELLYYYTCHGSKLFELEKENNTTKDTLEKAVLSYADLTDADLKKAIDQDLFDYIQYNQIEKDNSERKIRRSLQIMKKLIKKLFTSKINENTN